MLLSDDAGSFATPTLSVVFNVAAPRLGPATPATAAASKRGDWEILTGGRARVGEAVLEPGEFELRVTPLDDATTRPLRDHAGVVVLDTAVTDDLALEGTARDLVRSIQAARRENGLDVTDRITLELAGDTRLEAALEVHGEWIAEQVLAASVTWVELPDGEGWSLGELADGTAVALRVTRA